MQDRFKILAIDGGGIRGVFPAQILACIEERLGFNIRDSFDLIAGTSTGSIIAAALATEICPANIVELFKSKGPAIFPKTRLYYPRWLKPALSSRYHAAPLEEVLGEFLGETKLGEIEVPLLLPATDVGAGSVHVLKSSYSSEFTRDKNVLLKEAVLASCSAPTYFDPTQVGNYLLADGGLWANNPTLAAVIDAKRRLDANIESISVLSLGTGHSKKSYGVNAKKKWGLLNGWGGTAFINFMMSLQSQSAHNYTQLILKPEQLLRIDFESDLPLELDDCSVVPELISRADRIFTHQSEKIRKFFEGVQQT